MMLKLKLTGILLFLTASLFAQTAAFEYKRDMGNISDTWQRLALPNKLFSNAQPNLADLRIFGVAQHDTLEVPYLIKTLDDQVTSTEVSLKTINTSNNEKGFFYTFEVPSKATINELHLNFEQKNFDWNVNLEGSNDNKEWFTVLSNYRILSIENASTKYNFTSLKFPSTKYLYFRIAIKAEKQPTLNDAKIYKIDTVKGVYHDVEAQSYQIKNNKNAKETVANISFQNLTPISYLKVNVQHNFDFYRPIKIEYATDSFKTDKGIAYNYALLADGTLSSLEDLTFNFNNTLATRLRITVQNNDNAPLLFSGFEIKGNSYEMLARFDNQHAKYALYYGNTKAVAPNYDLDKFKSKIPLEMPTVNLGNEQKNSAYSVHKEKPLFEKKAWLWVLMAAIIALLGWFSFKMLRN
ncbi:hypothetical protein ABIB40_003821 [Pedobacter sp. UYP30]|uniref:DUF3999 family protein n=1 Tax=Pedobacter sp. UYP30 TaxID=1756400 RepID=UPI003394EAA6